MNQIKIPRISASTLATLKACPHKFKLQYLLGAQSPVDIPTLNAPTAGGAFAAGVQKVLTSPNPGSEESLALGIKVLLENLPQSFEPPRDPATLSQALIGYFDTWGGTRYKTIEAEFTFAGPLPIEDPQGNPYIYEGRIDSLVEGPDGLWIQDEKTTTRLGPTWPSQWQLRSQFFGYMWACKEAGYPIQGVIIRGIGLYKSQPPQFVETRVLYDAYLVERWYNSTLMWLETLNKYLKEDSFPLALDEACVAYAGCQFRDSCGAQNPEEWITFKDLNQEEA